MPSFSFDFNFNFSIMEGEGESQEWELLNHSSDNALLHSDEGLIRSDYFSIDSHIRYVKSVAGADVSQEGLLQSGNPSWIDPGPEYRCGRKNSGDFWSDSGSDRFDERKFGDFDAKNELGLVEMKSQLGIEGDAADWTQFESCEGKYSGLVENEINDVGYKGCREISGKDNDLGRLCSHSGGDVLVSLKLGHSVMVLADYGQGGDELGLSDGSEGGNGSNTESAQGEEHSKNGGEDGAVVEMKSDAEPVDVGEKRRVVWWKFPFEFLKYYAFQVSPFSSFSIAAALMGFIILARRLSRMKRKNQSLQLKITMDEKKVSLFKSRAARLNEAFSVVRRVPVIRPSHPAVGMTSWPMMSLR